ncbi:MAG: carboxypeptidase-like regulatory domain-containing protein [Agriterribacter sp.]
MRKLQKLFALTGCGLLFFLNVTVSQTKQLKGKVTDARDGAPISGATIQAKNASVSTITDASGSFQLTVPESVTQLVVSFVGFKKFEVSVNADL